MFMLAYLAESSLLAFVPAVLVLIATALTIIQVFFRCGMVLAGPIARIFLGVLLMLVFFLVKHLVIAGYTGVALAIKIAAYHTVFMSGLLLGYNYSPLKGKLAPVYAVMLWILPIMFFLLVAKGRPPSDALFVFNRNPFAAYTITSSALLLGFSTDRQLVRMGTYIVLVTAVLILNSTLGALLAFLLSVVMYIGPKTLLNHRARMSALSLVLIFGGFVFYININPSAFSNIEAFERLSFVIGIFSNMLDQYHGSWLELDMATAVSFAPSNELDMSAIFRIIHWINILSVLVSDGSGALWIGGGTDWIDVNEHRFTYSLAAHNEYIRLIAEQGLLHTILIFGAIFAAIFSLRRSLLCLPLMGAAIFFASENTFNDFVSTAAFFLILGHSVGAERYRRVQIYVNYSPEKAANPIPSHNISLFNRL